MHSSFFVLFYIVIFLIPSHSKAKVAPSNLTGIDISYHTVTARSCLSKQTPSSEVKNVLARNNMKVDGVSTEALEKAMATVAQKFEALGRSDLIKGLVVKDYPGGRDGKCTNYTSGPKLIKMVTSCPLPNGQMRNSSAAEISLSMIHEFFHTVGQQGYYKSYQSSVPACHVTGYCYHNDNPSSRRNEEFAEVGAMFVHSPQTLKKYCPQAYDFFKKNIFNGRESDSSICQGIPETAIAGLGAPSENNNSVSSDYNGGSTDQLMQLAQNLIPLLQAAQNKPEEPAAQAPAVQVIPKTAPAAQCNRSSGQCGDAVR